jgi:hypothetical protein
LFEFYSNSHMQHLKEGMIGELSESCVLSIIEQKLCK